LNNEYFSKKNIRINIRILPTLFVSIPCNKTKNSSLLKEEKFVSIPRNKNKFPSPPLKDHGRKNDLIRSIVKCVVHLLSEGVPTAFAGIHVFTRVYVRTTRVYHLLCCCCSSSCSSCCSCGHINQNTAFLSNFTMLSAYYCIQPCPAALRALARQPCPAALPGSLARQPCPAALPGSLARQPCPAALPGSLARQPCPAALPGRLARQPCPAALPGSLARQPCP
jgi:hypothetical protein